MKLSRLVLFASLMFATAAYTAAQSCTRHFESQGGFSICIPDGWVVKEQQGEAYKMLFGEPSDGFAPNVNVKEGISDLEINAFVAAGIEWMLANKEKIGVTSIQVQGQSDFVTDAGVRGVRVAFLSEYKGLWVRSIQYILPASPTRKLVVTGTSLDKNKEVFDRILDRSAKSFRIG